MKRPPILITGAAGFIGMHLSKALLEAGESVIGIDEINSYYDVRLKHGRLKSLGSYAGFRFEQFDIGDTERLTSLMKDLSVDYVVNLAAQAGVRYSLVNPRAYTKANVEGFLSVLEACRASPVKHLLYASSSSVYGGNTSVPFRETDPVNLPVSYYAATKRANELMAQVYASQFGIPCSGLRFFTVYGPMGRPDMAYWSFTEKILAQQPIPVYGNGLLSRDFTFVDDVVAAIAKLIPLAPPAENLTRILNVGNSNPHSVNELIEAIEGATGRQAQREYRPQPLGDVDRTYADSSRLAELTGFHPATPLADGISRFVEWYRSYQRSV